MSSQISIIVPAFNQFSYTKNCLETLLSDPEVTDLAEIIVVDNASTDATQQYLQDNAARITSIRMSENTGYSRACNAGFEVSKGSEIVFLNNDTIPEQGWLNVLRKTLALSGVGLVAPKLLYPKSRTINSAGYVYNKSAGAFYPIYHDYPENFSGVNRRREFQAVLGACVMLRRELFIQIGGISDFGYDDLDLCFKIRSQGYKIVYEPQAAVLHHGSITLLNSLAGSIPLTDNTTFGERWPRATFAEDDAIYYSEDGFEFVSITDGLVSLKETISEATENFNKAVAFKQNGQIQSAKVAFESAIQNYLGDERSYEELILLLIDSGNLSEAIKVAEKMCQHVVNAQQSTIILASLLVKADRAAEGMKILVDLLADWSLHQSLREKALKLLERHKFCDV